MINILVIEAPILNAVTWWRFFRPFEVMRRLYPGRFNITFKRKLETPDLFFNDVFILSRPHDGDLIDFVARARDHGKPVIVDIDDDTINLPNFHPLKASYDKRRQISLELFSLADRIWASTRQLLYVTDALNRGDVIPNAILPSDLPDEPAPDRGRWAWRGKEVQMHDLVTVGAEQYEKIKTRAASWTFMGILPPFHHVGEVHLVDYERDVETYFRLLTRARFNGIWKPLMPCLFNDSKSNIAWLESLLTGGVCLTNYAGKEGWEYATAEWPESYDHAVDLWQKGGAHALKHYNLNDTTRQRAKSIFNLLETSEVERDVTCKADLV